MAHPETTHGYARVANELLEAMYRDAMHSVSTRILLWVIRHAYGWFDRTEKRARVTCAFSWAKIAKDLGLSRQAVSRAGQYLLKNGRLRLDARQKIGIQKDYDLWKKCGHGGARNTCPPPSVAGHGGDRNTCPPPSVAGASVARTATTGVRSPQHLGGGPSYAREKTVVKERGKASNDPPTKTTAVPVSIWDLQKANWPIDPRRHPDYNRLRYELQEELDEAYLDWQKAKKLPYPSIPGSAGICARCHVEHHWQAECFAPWAPEKYREKSEKARSDA